jgi:hypothetical protein
MGKGRRARWIAGLSMVLALSPCGLWAGCDDPTGQHCVPPPPPCSGCEAALSTFSVSSQGIQPAAPIAHGRRLRGRELRLWFLLSFRTLLAAARTF